MKQMFLIILLLLTKSIMAEDYYAKISLGQQDGKDGQQDAIEGGFVLGLKLNSNFSTEIKVMHKQKDNKGFSTRIGVAILGKVKLLDNLSAYMRVGAGNKKTNTNTFNFWVITPGLKYKIDDKWSIKGGVRFRDAFDTDQHRDYTKTFKVGIGYKFTENKSLSIGFKRKVGDSEYNAISVGYGIGF
ncbi:MAG: outer membrane beta-barrel protein [Methylophilaceae bacterium]